MGDKYSGGDYVPVRGMSLRDWYAGQALQALTLKCMEGMALEDIAEYSFSMAEAMMAERKKRHKSGNIEVNGIWYIGRR